MQQSNRTVIFGEAPEESDSEEIQLNDDEINSTSEQQQDHHHHHQHQINSQNIRPDVITNELGHGHSQQTTTTTTKGRSGFFGTSLFASIGGGGSSSSGVGLPSSTFAKLAKYSPYELLSSTIGQPKLITTVGKNDRLSTELEDSPTTSSSLDGNINQLGKQAPQQLPPLHRTLYTKNYQFKASLDHLYKQPLQVAAKSVHSMSQCLVNDQKIIQEVNNAMIKIQRELRNLDIGINKIV